MSLQWAGVLVSIQDGLRRAAQEIDGIVILPDRIHARLPAESFGRWAPVLEQVTGELGEALVEWAGARGHSWYGGEGPSVEVELAQVDSTEVEVEYSSGVR